jgi:hypothetical protein
MSVVSPNPEDDVVASARALRDRLASAVELKHRTDVNNAALRHQLAVSAAHHNDALAAHTARLERTHADAIASCLRAVVDVERQHAELHQALLDAKDKADADTAAAAAVTAVVAAATNTNTNTVAASTAPTTPTTTPTSPAAATKDLSSSRTRSTRRKNSSAAVAVAAGTSAPVAAAPPIPSLDDAPAPPAPAPLGGTPLAVAASSLPPVPPLPASPR